MWYLECHYYFKWPNSSSIEYCIINGEKENGYAWREFVPNIEHIHCWKEKEWGGAQKYICYRENNGQPQEWGKELEKCN